MKINFLVPTTGVTGGIKAVFEHANNFAAWGHEVAIICPFTLDKNAAWIETAKGLAKRLRREILGLVGLDKVSWFDLSGRVRIIRVTDLSARHIPSADAIIATANETADWLADYPESKGGKVLFCSGL